MMKVQTAYPDYVLSLRRYASLNRSFFLFTFFLLLVNPGFTAAQEEPEYDEISILLTIPRIGAGEIDAAIRGNELYLPVTDLFDFLKIRNIPSPGLETISGFFIDPEAGYVISRTDNNIRYGDKVYNLEPGDLLRTESNLYLRSVYFGSIFGLECTFNFRSLSVTVSSKLELPLVREMRLEEMRRNLTRLKGEVKADTNIGRSYPLFRFGMADWSAVASEEINGRSDTRLNLSLGAMIAGGEATASLYYNTTDPFTGKQQYYLWRYVNNDFTPIRQVMAGKIAANAISSIYNPVIGVQMTNTPTTYRRSFGSYTLSDMTEPEWIVELYVNNVLVDYTKADASGFFSFEVPLVYGNSMVKLKFFGPWGEERTKEQNIHIPFSFLPHKTMEYRLSAGIVEDSLASRFSGADIKYGLTRSITFGGGMEYLSSVTSGPFMPFLNTSLRITNNLLLTAEYTYGVRAKSTLSFRLPSNLQLDLNYTWYEKDQTAINFNYREERRAMVSVPLRLGRLATFQRLSLYQIVLPAADYTTGEWLFSGSLRRVSTNLTTYALLLSGQDPYIYSNLSMAFRLPGRFVIRPQVQYAYTSNGFLSAKLMIEKHLKGHGFLNASYEQNFKSHLKMAELGFRYDFSFSQAGVSVRQSDRNTTLLQYARGSLINDGKTKYLGADNRTNVGRGGISIVPYFDLNNNGKRDPGEPKVYGLNLRAHGGRVEKSERDTTIRIFGLEPYTECFIELDPYSFDNIAWRLPIQTLSVSVDPNIMKLVEIPVTIAGEASGTVTLEKDGESRGLGRIIVHFLNQDLMPVGRTLTENDGYFSYLGLPPGNYTVQVDTAQLRKLDMKSEPVFHQFSIEPGLEGDFVEGLDFKLQVITVDTAIIPPVIPAEPIIIKDTTYLILHEITEVVHTITEDSWAIQIGAFKQRSNAEVLRKKIEAMLDKEVQITIEGDFFRVRVLDLPTRQEVDEKVAILHQNGYSELWIVRLLAGQQQTMLVTREDSIAVITETTIERPSPVFPRDIMIQVGAFKQEDNATALRNKLSVLVEKPVIIVPEGGYFKVQITGFENLQELEKMLPVLRFIGMKDIWIPPVRTEAEAEPEPEPLPPILLPETIKEMEPEPEVPTVEEMPVAETPTIALQVAIFNKRHQALRAQRRITTRINLPVDVVERWGNYYVIVTGFFTREETARYYPELAGLGYYRITLIENYKRP